jgi:hypothetical protein
MRLFLSYQTQDAALAKRLHAALLRQRPAFEIFLDREKLLVGDVWQQRLVDELSAADGVLLLLGYSVADSDLGRSASSRRRSACNCWLAARGDRASSPLR